MDDYQEHLQRLVVHDEALIELLTRDGSSLDLWALDRKTAALARLAATIAVGAAISSFQHAVAHALAARASRDEIVGTLETVTPVTGAARVVECAPEVALALGYDVEEALELRAADEP